jgi:hypothetical protein
MPAIKDKVGSFKDGLIHGIGWAFGVTIGFLILSAILWFLANRLEGFPLGKKIQDLVRSTTESTYTRTPTIPD